MTGREDRVCDPARQWFVSCVTCVTAHVSVCVLVYGLPGFVKKAASQEVSQVATVVAGQDRLGCSSACPPAPEHIAVVKCCRGDLPAR